MGTRRSTFAVVCVCVAAWRFGVQFSFSQTAPPATDDSALRIELAKDGLRTLLDRAYVVDNIPSDQRAPELAVVALSQLNDSKLSDAERSAKLQQIVEGIGPAVGSINDPQVLLAAAAALVKQGVTQDANVLEYFGEDSADATKARLHPVAAAAVQLYDRAVTLLDQKQSALQDKITRPDDPIAAQWQSADQDFQTASYTRWMLSYSLALSMERADKNRGDICDAAIQNLAQWDTPDSGVQPIVRLQIAKLNMLKGTRADLTQAKELLQTISLPAGVPGGVNPRADRYTQFFGKYFIAVCDVLGKNLPAAQRDAQLAEDFRLRELATDNGDLYAMDVLHYRIALLQGDDAAAMKILEDLSDKAPGLRSVIAARLLDKLPDHPDIATLSPPLLSALVARAAVQVNQANPDPAILEEGLAAARQYLVLADNADPQVTQEATLDASLIRGDILRIQGQTAAAAAAYLDHAQRYKDDPNPNAKAAAALDAAINQIALIYHNGANDPHQSDVAELQDKVLPLAVESFRRYDLAYEYARSLQRAGHSAKAADIFTLVPADDPNAFNAAFFKMVALNQRLDADRHDAENAVAPQDLPSVLDQVQKLADQVAAEAQNREDAATGSKLKTQFQSMRARTILLAADVAGREGRDPKRTLTLLTDFEKTIDGLPDAKPLLGEALNLRVAAYMAGGDTTKATDSLLEYLNTVGGNEGLQTVYNLLAKLNADLDRAQAVGDSARIKQLADDRAALTPFLVKWASTSTNPDISKFTYRYRVFDAATQQQAAELESDSAKRTVKLQEALARFQELQQPQNVALYQSSLPPDATPDVRDYPDPAVTLGIADVAFDIGDWKQVHDAIGQLLADSKLGDGTTTITNAAGQSETADNDQFWEAQYKFIYATAQLSKDPSSGVNADTPRIILDRLTATWQDSIGGKKWHGKFEQLAKDLGQSGEEGSPAKK